MSCNCGCNNCDDKSSGTGLWDPRVPGQTWPIPSNNPLRPMVPGISKTEGITSPVMTTAISGLGSLGADQPEIPYDKFNAQSFMGFVFVKLGVCTPANLKAKFKVGNDSYRVPLAALPQRVLDTYIPEAGTKIYQLATLQIQKCNSPEVKADADRRLEYARQESARQDAVDKAYEKGNSVPVKGGDGKVVYKPEPYTKPPPGVIPPAGKVNSPPDAAKPNAPMKVREFPAKRKDKEFDDGDSLNLNLNSPMLNQAPPPEKKDSGSTGLVVFGLAAAIGLAKLTKVF